VDNKIAFEAWARSKGYDPDVKLMLTSYPPQDGGYVNAYLNQMWDAWQAAMAYKGVSGQ